MQNLITIYNQFSIYIAAALTLIVLILFIFIIVNVKSIGRVERKLRKLTRGNDNSNLEEIIKAYMDKVEDAVQETEDAKKLYSDIQEKVDKCVQNVAIIRYKAFEDVGSDLSFSIAMLDNNKNGVIITSIYGRDESTTYAKPIDKGISRYDLSNEEKTVLESAVNKIK